MILPAEEIARVVRVALAEDLGEAGDITSRAAVPSDTNATARFVAKADGVVAGLPLAEEACRSVDTELTFEAQAHDGDKVADGACLAVVTGRAVSILTAERTALNFMTHLSGIATLTAMYVAACDGLPARIVDTRKTTPGLRTLEKYAVACGGGVNHRFGLYDGILIKDNHIAAAGGIASAVAAVKSASPKLAPATPLPIQVEVDTLGQLREAIQAGADSVLLDNMSPEMTGEAVRIARSFASGGIVLESSGGIGLANVRRYAEAGVDRISVGALTHSAPAFDISLDFSTVV